jgi:acyl-coenzyme A thioesterase PaaI-like protein
VWRYVRSPPVSEHPAHDLTQPHFNQPDGPVLGSTHPRAANREVELRSMADAVRRLITITVDSDADVGATAAAASRLHALADELEALRPASRPSKHGVGADPETSHPHDHFQFDAMLGLFNPLALPVRMEWRAPVAYGFANFTSPYEGPPGCVHGAIIAGVFDQVFNVANVKADVTGPTAFLHIDYKRPTLLESDLVFEGWVDRVEGRKTFCRGRIVQFGAVTAEAEGLFVQIGAERMLQFGSRPD